MSRTNRTRIGENYLIRLHRAAKMIETDGSEAFHAVTDLFGEEVALALLVAHIRRSVGSTYSFPPRDDVETRTNATLKEFGFL